MIPDELENPESVDQRLLSVLKFLWDHPEIFSRQGSVVRTWRLYRSRRLGPYYRLAFREDGRQRSWYLGSSSCLAEEVRKALRQMQAPLRQRRYVDQVLAAACADLQHQKAEFDRRLQERGLQLKGFGEIRGWRNLGKTGRSG